MGSSTLFSSACMATTCPRHRATSSYQYTLNMRSRKTTLLVSYLQSYLSKLQQWLTEWRIAINFSKSSAIIFARVGRRLIQPRPVTLFGEPIKWVDTNRYLRVTQDKQLNLSPHIDQVRSITTQRMCLLGSFLDRRTDPSIRNGVLL
jgi:hypothetical protein